MKHRYKVLRLKSSRTEIESTYEADFRNEYDRIDNLKNTQSTKYVHLEIDLTKLLNV